jgi:hypothetical protein
MKYETIMKKQSIAHVTDACHQGYDPGRPNRPGG